MGLDLNIAKLSGPGRRPAQLVYEVERPLTEADVELLSLPANIEPPSIQRITDRHHALARLLAAGVKEGEAALIVGYELSRVSILKNSPAFQQLLDLYRKEAQAEFVSVLDHMAGLSRDALLTLRERLETTPDRFAVRELLTIVTETVDRTAMREERSSVPMPEMIELVAPDRELPSDES